MIKPDSNPEESPMGRWVSYRPDIKILDCTVRDGGLMNNHLFDDEIVKSIFKAYSRHVSRLASTTWRSDT